MLVASDSSGECNGVRIEGFLCALQESNAVFKFCSDLSLSSITFKRWFLARNLSHDNGDSGKPVSISDSAHDGSGS